MSIQKHLLNNDITLLTEPIATSKTVAIGFWFSVGSRHEPKILRGITHFVEHMLFKGTKTRTAYQIACSFDKVGGYVNAFTERDVLCLHATVPKLHANLALDVMLDMVYNSLFLADDIEKERKVIKNEIISSKDDPEEAASDAMYKAFFANDPLALPIAGTLSNLAKIKRDDLLNWYKTYIQNGSFVVTVAGNFDENFFVQKISTLQKRCNSQKTLQSAKCAVFKSVTSAKNASFQQNQLFVAYPIKHPLSQKMHATICLVNAIVGDTMSSRLFQGLREKMGFCYNVYSFFVSFYDVGFWCAYASVTKRNTKTSLKYILQEIEQLLQNGINDEELVSAKEHLCGEEIIASEETDARMKRLYRLYFSGFDLQTIEEYCKTITSITKEEVLLCIKELFDAKKRAIFLYGKEDKL